MNGGADVGRLVEHLFRRQSAKMLATLTRHFGVHNLDLVEEVVQDALIRALQQWPFHGVPVNPSAWLIQTAKHRALDVLRRRALHDRNAGAIAVALHGDTAVAPESVEGAETLSDDELRMMFMCCHPLLEPESQTALMLNTVAGFNAREVARAFLLPEPTAAQRLVRTKRRLREARAAFELPPAAELPTRLGAVLDALYLLFTAGYAARTDEGPVRRELCAEAMRLTVQLSRHEHTARPEVHALLALMCFQAARLGTRTDEEGELLLLDEQDRDGWDHALIGAGFTHLERSAAGDVITPYHLQAGISACHAAAPTWDATDWPRILALYDQLLALQPSPVVALNRAVAVAMVHGPEAALVSAEALRDEPAFRSYVLLPATLAELYRRAGQAEAARRELERALKMQCSGAERRTLLGRLGRAR
jgi:RNA polymerase sigma factor (sigma-70 family)